MTGGSITTRTSFSIHSVLMRRFRAIIRSARLPAFSTFPAHSELAALYSKLGRPSIDPVLMIRMLLVGYAFAIRSSGCSAVGQGQPSLSLVLWASR